VVQDTPEIRDVREAQAAQADWAVASHWRDAAELWDHLRTHTNIVTAAERVDWSTLLSPGTTVLDLGCGSGWLSAMLSTQPQVERVIAWDSSPALLRDLLPDMIGLVGGVADKIDRVCGDFVPLLLDDASVQAVVMSSAFHHAEQPEALLAELSRVLAPGGVAVLLNETPWHRIAIVGFATRMYAAALAGLAGRITHRPGHLGSRHVLYDETLGDRAYSLPAWRQMLGAAGFRVEVRDTGMTSYPESYRPPGRFEPRLIHFVLRPREGAAGGGGIAAPK
jgi:ubiquinone/menaquinone biosynthesis C-methylase UbiE